jgi:hypothetical protein
MSIKILGIPALLFIVAFLASCSSATSTTGTPGSAQTPHTMIATVNGASWSSAMNGIYAGAYAAHYGPTGVMLTGIAADSSEFTIIITNLTRGSVGTDSLGATTGNYAMYSLSGPPNTSTSFITTPAFNQIYSGSVTVTSYDTTTDLISGQFQFVGRKANSLSDSVTVTSGSFYQLQFAV